MVGPYVALVAVVGLERLVELRTSHRNATEAFAAGGVEMGGGHFGVMRLLHTAWLAGCLAEVVYLQRSFISPWGWLWLGAVVLAQALRYWAVLSLGRAWNVRVIVVPGALAISRGPYRWLRHPNYVAVVIEGLALPMVHNAWLTATLFFVANSVLLRHRLACEERALLLHLRNYEQVGRQR